jgi:pantoate--beta-alanine ligase
VEIVGMPIIREPDGLALSSRNVYLEGDDRRAALVLSRAVERAQRLYAQGERDAARIRGEMQHIVACEPRAQIDYVSVADAETLDELAVIDRPTLASLAVRIGPTRLIDNTSLG